MDLSEFSSSFSEDEETKKGCAHHKNGGIEEGETSPKYDNLCIICFG